jgi:arylformamidase
LSLTEVIVRADVGGRELRLDLGRPASLAIELNFSPHQPRHFGAPAATSSPFAVPGFSGAVATGASCNCNTLTLTPHCNGTHTECVGHLTREPLDAHRVVPLGLIPTLLVSLEPVPARASGEGTEPIPKPTDLLITRQSLEKSWGAATAPAALPTAAPAPFQPRALVIRTLPNSAAKQHQDYSNQTPPYLSREAAELLVARGIEHLVVDLPSIDRAHDEGRLTAHRIFFGLGPGETTLAHATRANATVTELAYIPDTLTDGPYFLELQVPALGGDAVPSRPLLYSILSG